MLCFNCCNSTKIDDFNTDYADEHFDLKDYEPKKLGVGAFSTVYKIKIKNENYTCKKLLKKNRQKFYREIQNLIMINKISCSRFPIFYKGIVGKIHDYILYEYIEGLDLFTTYENILYPEKMLTYTLVSQIIKEITLACYNLFQHNLLHLDLKMENIICLNLSPVKIKLIDLESCRSISEINNFAKAGTYGYTAPEVILSNKYYHNTDVWSIGVIFYLLLTNKLLLPNSKYEYINEIKNFKSVYDIENNDFLNLNIKVQKLIAKMLEPIHTYRISLKKILHKKCIKTPQLYNHKRNIFKKSNKVNPEIIYI